MRIYYLIVAVLGFALVMWTTTHYDLSRWISMGLGFMAGTLGSTSYTMQRRKR